MSIYSRWANLHQSYEPIRIPSLVRRGEVNWSTERTKIAGITAISQATVMALCLNRFIIPCPPALGSSWLASLHRLSKMLCLVSKMPCLPLSWLYS